MNYRMPSTFLVVSLVVTLCFVEAHSQQADVSRASAQAGPQSVALDPARLAAVDEETKRSKDAYDRITSATTSADLSSIVGDLRYSKVPVGLVGLLIRDIGKNDDCRWSNEAADHDGQDLSFKGGRSAWVLSNVLGYQLPRVTKEISEDEAERIGYLAENMEDALVDTSRGMLTLDLDDMPSAGKKALASSNDTSPTQLRKLGMDPDVEVRRLTAANKKSPANLLIYMSKWDVDGEVKAMAKHNLKAARTPTTQQLFPTTDTLYFIIPKSRLNQPQ